MVKRKIKTRILGYIFKELKHLQVLGWGTDLLCGEQWTTEGSQVGDIVVGGIKCINLGATEWSPGR